MRRASLTPDLVPGIQPEAPGGCASVEPLPTPLQKGGVGGQEAEGRTRSRTPEMRRPQGLRGLALPAPLRRVCSHCAFLGSAWKRRELRFALLAGRRDGGAGHRFLPRHAQLDCSVPHSRQPSPETPVPKRQGIDQKNSIKLNISKSPPTIFSLAHLKHKSKFRLFFLLCYKSQQMP